MLNPNNNLCYYLKLIKPYIGQMILRLKRAACQGQTLAEYGIVLSLVAAALTGMSVFVQRAIQARYKDATDGVAGGIEQTIAEANSNIDITLPADFQTEPYYSGSDMDTQRQSRQSLSYFYGGRSTREFYEYSSSSGGRDESPYSDGAR